MLNFGYRKIHFSLGLSLVSIWSYIGRKNRVTIFLNGQFIMYSSLVIITPRIYFQF
jgi:hypothetical protein